MKVLSLLVIAFLVISLIAPCDGAKDRRKKKQQQRHEDSGLEERESDNKLDEQKDREQEKQERVHALVERQEERKKEKDDESSEEKSEEEEDKKDKNGTSAEIFIPRAKRMTHVESVLHRTKRQGDMQTMKKSTEINDGAKLPISKRPTQEESPKKTGNNDGTIEIRRRRSTDIVHETKKSPEINDGKQIEIENRPKHNEKN